MTDQEKLVEMINHVCEGHAENLMQPYGVETLTRHLIANGVTVQPVTEKRTGLYGKYSIFRADGTPVKDRCFVLKPDKDPIAVKALQTYAAATDDEQLRNELYDWVGKLMSLPEPPKEE